MSQLFFSNLIADKNAEYPSSSLPPVDNNKGDHSFDSLA
jgi:hypothetical protein